MTASPTDPGSLPPRLAWVLVAWVALLALAWLAYRPGLSGGFLFDDFVNLSALGDKGPVVDADAFWRYVTSGRADPTGRPLALLTFLLDARDWPADPAPFLRTNLILHLANATLLFALLRRLGRFLGPAGAANDRAALLGAGLWLLHPLLVSTTLYAVQREAMLPATFVLAGLLAYAVGRERLATPGARGGLAWMAAGLGLGTVLATLCKANGILMPLLALTLEATVFALRPVVPGAANVSRRFRQFRVLCLVLPSLAVFAYLGSYLLRWNQTLHLRPWTIGERVLTQGRVLFDYANLLVVPRSVSTGLYNDDYVLSTGLWQPVSTALCWALLLALGVLAWRWRRRAPALAAAVLFFFAGHALESTTLPLELYFEHRNYLPALLLFWPLARLLVSAPRPAPAWRAVAAVGLLLLLAATTYQRATLWGHPQRLAELWAGRNPDSSRAQATLAIQYMKDGRPDLALARLGPLWQAQPHDPQLALNYVNAACSLRGLTRAEAARLRETLEHTGRGVLLVRQWLANAIAAAGAGRCRGLDLPTVEGWLATAESNPAISEVRAGGLGIATLRGMLELERQQPDAALRHFNRALEGATSPEIVVGQTAMLGQLGYYAQARAHLDAYEHIEPAALKPSTGMRYVHALVLERQGYWQREMDRLRTQLDAELAGQAGPSP